MTESSNLQEEETTIMTSQPSREEASLSSSLNNHHHQEEEEKKETDTSIRSDDYMKNGESGSGGGGGGDTSTTKEDDGEDDDSDDDDDDDDDSSDDYDSDEERDDFSISMREEDEEGDETSFMSHDGSTDASSVGTEEQSIASGYSGFSGGASSAENQSEADASSRKLTQKEDAAVRYGRILMYLLLISIGVVLSYTLFRVVRENELESFEESFTIWSDDLGTAWKSNIVDAFMALDSLSVDLTTSATTTANSPENSWPFVTVPNYKIFSTVSLSSSTALITTSMVPRVIQSQRTEYENYTSSTLTTTTTESFMASNNGNNNNNNRRRNLQSSTTTTGIDSIIPSQIYAIDDNGQPVADDGSNNDAYYPIRYIDPINLKSINYNLVSNSYMEYPIAESNYKGEAILGLTLDDNNNPDTTTLLEMYSQTNNTDYLGTITFPILDDLSLMSTNKDRTAVGVLPGLVSWNSLFDNNVLPTDINGIIAVVENNCVQGFTMEINGAGVSFVGIGDHHDPKFDGYKSDTFTLQNLDLNTATKVEFDNAASCNYQVSFYPSQITIDDYTSIISSSSSSSSNEPVIYAVAVAVSFFIVLLIVCTYDCIQERRNQSVRKAAMEARAIVSSLFPAVVRDRLFETNRKERKERKKKRRRLRRRRKNKKDKKLKNGDDNNNNNADGDGSIKVPGILDTSMADMEMAPLHNSRLDMDTVQHLVDTIHMTGRRGSFDGSTDGNNNYKSNKVSHPKHRLKNYLSTPTSSSSPSGYGGGYDGSGDNKSEEFTKLGKPIADLFPHTTVLFADIVGFTAWSSEREPEQVFTLLQTVYHAFDRVAKRRGVFKVETIGDCYVAVTGLPDPQPDHAVRMAKFARECVTKMAELTKKLEVSLGPDTGDLCMRLGLHSGPVTAGVLMGEKSRFQLFGDTVNTASRMESTGEKNRIQISKATADLLIEAGKSYWVKPRDDLVHAKGKGQVQTFWLVGSRGSNLHASHSINSETGGALGLRRAPPRTRSALSSGGPVRGIKRAASESKRFGSDSAISQGSALNDRREERLIQWQVELFARLLKKIVASRAEKAKKVDNNITEEENPASEPIVEDDNDNDESEGSYRWTEDLSIASGSVAPPADRFAGTNATVEFDQGLSFRKPTRQPSLKFGMDSAHSTARKSVYSSSMNDSSTASFGKIVFDEVAEIITLPKFSPEAIKALAHSDNVVLGETVMEQLKDYISTIAQLYRKNPFHNFEHASHVTMSANKLLNRIVIPENVDYERESNAIASDLHDYTYGITSDSLTQFAIVFSALVHDADHTGVPNAQLAKENPDMAILYRNQSIAEQNSVDLAWDLFMDPRYKDLQDCVAANAEERKRFRQLVVNSVMATDIFDKDMKELRNTRWDKAFHREATEKNRIISESSIEEDRNMKATIVIEHIIQASDVAHTMQHWHIYQKWNERLFEEMFSAFECGRSEKNPADFWYKGELWFFDNYVIPLAKKLEECNVFGVASDECLNYAEANRNEWSVKGEECIQQMVDRYHKRKFFVAGIAKKRNPKTASVNRRMIMNRPDNRIPAADPQTPPRQNVQKDDTIPGLPKRQSSIHRSSQH